MANQKFEKLKITAIEIYMIIFTIIKGYISSCINILDKIDFSFNLALNFLDLHINFCSFLFPGLLKIPVLFDTL